MFSTQPHGWAGSGFMWAFRGVCVCSSGWAVGVFREMALGTCCVFSTLCKHIALHGCHRVQTCWEPTLVLSCSSGTQEVFSGRSLVVKWWWWWFSSCSALVDVLRGNGGMWNWAGFEACGLCLPVAPIQAPSGLQEQILDQNFGKCGAQACASLPYLPVLSYFWY